MKILKNENLIKAIKDKEIQLVKEFKNILERFPLDFANAIFSQLIIIALSDKNKNDFYYLIQLDTEKKLFDTNQWRIDLSVKWLTDKFTNLFFEFKRGEESWKQLDRYYEAHKREDQNSNPLIVSVCKKKSQINQQRHNNIISLTWEEFAKGLSKALGYDAIKRLEFENENGNNAFSPDFPKRKLGEPVESLLEDFLRKIKDQKLMESYKDRVLVVTGEKATKSSKEANITWFGKNWDRSFEYIIVVFDKKIQYAGKVNKVYEPDDYNDTSENDIQVKRITSTLEKLNLEEDEKSGFRNSPVAEMTKIEFPKEEWGTINYDSVYQKSGAITQSHRYFNSPSDFIKHFTSTEL